MPSRKRPSRDPAKPGLILARAVLADLVTLVLSHLGATAEVTASAPLARESLRRAPSVVVVDLTLRGARDVLAAAAEAGLLTVALVDLEAGGSSFGAFVLGADQVVRVPFTPDELAVRVGALDRRHGHRFGFVRARPADGLELSLDEHVHIGSRTIDLDPMQNSLLYLLASRPGRAVSFDDVRRLVWGMDRLGSDREVERSLTKLNRLLSDHDTAHLAIDETKRSAVLRAR